MCAKKSTDPEDPFGDEKTRDHSDVTDHLREAHQNGSVPRRDIQMVDLKAWIEVNFSVHDYSSLARAVRTYASRLILSRRNRPAEANPEKQAASAIKTEALSADAPLMARNKRTMASSPEPQQLNSFRT